jgi:hypothetical protein
MEGRVDLQEVGLVLLSVSLVDCPRARADHPRGAGQPTIHCVLHEFFCCFVSIGRVSRFCLQGVCRTVYLGLPSCLHDTDFPR